MSTCNEFITVHENRLFLGKVHMVTPELVEELLVSGHQIRKCLRQHPCCRKRYPLDWKCHEWKWSVSRDGTLLLPSSLSFVHAVRK